MLLAIAGFVGAVLVAPASVLRAMPQLDTTRGGMLRDHVSLHVAAGYAESPASAEDPRRGWAHSYAIELLRGGAYGELRVEGYSVPDRLKLQAARGGYLLRPMEGLAGGVTLGYRRADTEEFPDGFEIGFPLLFGGGGLWMRFDAAYVMSRSAGNWNWRYQAAGLIPGTRLVPGMSVDVNRSGAPEPPQSPSLRSWVFGSEPLRSPLLQARTSATSVRGQGLFREQVDHGG